MNYLIDSSAWIEYFRGNRKYLFLSELIKSNVICTNEIILSELLPSIIHKREKELANLLNAVRKNVLFIDWQEIRNMQLLNIVNGVNNIGIPDIIITQNCMQNESIIITNDKHFKSMAKYIPIKVKEIYG
jgi:predicted nucleic acid-binding protein